MPASHSQEWQNQSLARRAVVFNKERDMANEITGAYSARVNGKPTALAGCAVGNCPRAQRCLRADHGLAMRHPHNCGAEGQFFIPIAPAA